MKLKKFLGIIVATVATVGLTAVTYAANGEYSLTVGAPLNVLDLKELDKLEAGDEIVIPVDFSSADGTISSYGFNITYNSDILTAGITNSSTLSTVQTNALMGENAGKYAVGSSGGVLQYLNGFGTVNDMGIMAQLTPYANPTVNLTDTEFNVQYAMAYAQPDNQVEYYMCFTVKEDVTDLNKVWLLDYREDIATVKDGTGEHIFEASEISIPKFNACFGAFNINIDSSVLPYWIQGLYVSLDNGEAVPVTEYSTTDDVKYVFPVRITSNSGNETSVSVEVLADVSDDVDGTENSRQVSMGTFNVDLDSPTSYDDVTAAAQ